MFKGNTIQYDMDSDNPQVKVHNDSEQLTFNINYFELYIFLYTRKWYTRRETRLT